MSDIRVFPSVEHLGRWTVVHEDGREWLAWQSADESWVIADVTGRPVVHKSINTGIRYRIIDTVKRMADER